MSFLRPLLCLACVLPLPLAAQQPAPRRDLATIQQQFDQRRAELLKAGASAQQQRELMEELATELASFAKHEAKGAERAEAQLVLAHVLHGIDASDRAKEALRAIEPAQAGPVLLVHAAELAGILGLGEQRTAWIDAAVARTDAPREQRAEMATLLLTRLQEIDKGKQVFARMLEQAKDDEARAEVRWLEASATREREDLPDGAYDEALSKLAEEFPGTRYGSIARDRLAARELRVGTKPPALSLVDLDGKPVSLADYRGKVLLLDFWASWCVPCRRAAPFLRTLQQNYGDDGFAILSISVDEDTAAARDAIRADQMTWRHVHDGKGWNTEAALRYGVESVPHKLLLGRDGMIAALHVFAGDEQGQQDLEAAVRKALRR